ncbi:MAG: ComF family protein [Puniceicoccaceae bacterium]
MSCGIYLDDPRGGYTCEACRLRIAWIREPYCRCCGAPFYGKLAEEGACPVCTGQRPAFEQCRSLFLFEATGARIVHALKYEDGLWLRDEIALLLREEGTWEAYFGDACIVPVPLHRKKHRRRGFNQAAVIAAAIQQAFPSTKVSDCLVRVRKTPTQTFLSREERIRNTHGAFKRVHEPASGRRIVVVDDVLTTGATLSAAVTALGEGSEGRISAFTLAHG